MLLQDGGDEPGAAPLSVKEMHVWGDGVLVLASNMTLHACDDVAAAAAASAADGAGGGVAGELLGGAKGVSSGGAAAARRVYKMGTGLSEMRPATAMAVLPPRFTSSGLVEVRRVLRYDAIPKFEGSWSLCRAASACKPTLACREEHGGTQGECLSRRFFFGR